MNEEVRKLLTRVVELIGWREVREEYGFAGDGLTVTGIPPGDTTRRPVLRWDLNLDYCFEYLVPWLQQHDVTIINVRWTFAQHPYWEVGMQTSDESDMHVWRSDISAGHAFCLCMLTRFEFANKERCD